MSETIENIDFWQRHIEQLKTSGLSRKQYCREKDVNYDRFGYWLKRIIESTSGFVPVKLKSSETPARQSVLCTLELRGGTVKVHDLSALSLLIERLA